MKILSVSVKGYRSVESIFLNLDQINVFYGGNGVGKTNLYNSLKLLQAAANGSFATFLTQDGGMQSVLSESRKRGTNSSQLMLSVTFRASTDSELFFNYKIVAGLVPQKMSFGEKIVLGDGFECEPQIKSEELSFSDGRRSRALLSRKNSGLTAMDRDMVIHDLSQTMNLFGSATALSSLNEPNYFPELMAIRHEMLSWRFYHGFRTDIESPIRQPCYAVSGTVLNARGDNLAAVLATLKYVTQDYERLETAIADAFHGAELVIPPPQRTASFGLRFSSGARSYESWELSDGTLQYICLAAVLTSPSPPPFIVLNEPDNSLHPDLIKPLAVLINEAKKYSQIWVVTHSIELKEHLESMTGIKSKRVIKHGLHTWIEGLDLGGNVND